jgi:hypothetical protein
VTTPAGFDIEPNSYLVALTTPDGRVLAAIDLHYELAIETGPYETAGVYVDSQLEGARIVVDDGTGSAAFYMNAESCLSVSHYLLACAKAATDRQAAGT